MSAFDPKRTLASFPHGGFQSARSVPYHERGGLGVAMKQRKFLTLFGGAAAACRSRPCAPSSYLIGLNQGWCSEGTERVQCSS